MRFVEKSFRIHALRKDKDQQSGPHKAEELESVTIKGTFLITTRSNQERQSQTRLRAIYSEVEEYLSAAKLRDESVAHTLVYKINLLRNQNKGQQNVRWTIHVIGLEPGDGIGVSEAGDCIGNAIDSILQLISGRRIAFVHDIIVIAITVDIHDRDGSFGRHIFDCDYT